MRRMLLLVLLVCSGCSKESAHDSSINAKPETIFVDHVLPAFDGKLLGIDHGEFGGNLLFEDEGGRRTDLLDENVHGIVENPMGIFVFTGLAHMTMNEGYIYIVTKEPNGKIYPTMLGKLPGAPSHVTQIDRDHATFLVYAGFRDDAPYFECYALTGRIVSPSNECSPPKGFGD